MYERVNQIFADEILKIYKPGDTIWIHDYQLFMLPGLLREKIPDARIGFFLHIPFPSYELFRMLHRPWKEKIVNGLVKVDTMLEIPCYCDIQFKEREFLTINEFPEHPFTIKIKDLVNQVENLD